MRSVQPPDVTYRPLADAREHSELAVAFRRVERAPATKAFIEQMRGVAKRLVDRRLVEADMAPGRLHLTVGLQVRLHHPTLIDAFKVSARGIRHGGRGRGRTWG
jgi:hypothetical protein